MARKKPEGTLPLFPDPHPPPPLAEASEYVARNRDRIRRWAERGILFGSSSWKYPGWQGMVYVRRYPSKRAFDQESLAEYAQLFPTVCADFALYDFPEGERLREMHRSTPAWFSVSLKVTDRITVRRYPNLPRHGAHAGKENPDFLNLRLFEDAFLRPVEELKEKCGAIIFEFSTFYPGYGLSFAAFVDLLDRFLARLPRRFRYAVEVRNADFLRPEYFAMLAAHGAAHVLNNWTRTPPILEQVRLDGSFPAQFAVARALLKPGRAYEEAVKLFSPYEEIKEENPELRLGVAEAARRCITDNRTFYAYVNNRAEGNSPKTIEGILDILDRYPVETL